jgi:hypothetical protein
MVIARDNNNFVNLRAAKRDQLPIDQGHTL